MDKLRRDIKRHDEWYWLNIYDENGEIGKQAEWEPETQLTKMTTSFLYNMMFKTDTKKSVLTKEMREARLKELRARQGCDVETYKDSFMVDFHIDEH